MGDRLGEKKLPKVKKKLKIQKGGFSFNLKENYFTKLQWKYIFSSVGHMM